MNKHRTYIAFVTFRARDDLPPEVVVEVIKTAVMSKIGAAGPEDPLALIKRNSINVALATEDGKAAYERAMSQAMLVQQVLEDAHAVLVEGAPPPADLVQRLEAAINPGVRRH